MKALSFVAALLLAAVTAGCGAVGTPSRMTTEPVPEAGTTALPGETQASPSWETISAEAAKARMDSGDPVMIVDVRTAEEYEAGHIPGALLLPLGDIGDTPPALLPDMDAEILLYCRSGNRSGQAAKKLAAMGYTRIYDFGGILSWPYETVTGGTATPGQ